MIQRSAEWDNAWACSSFSKNSGVITSSPCCWRPSLEYQVFSIPKHESLISVTFFKYLFLSCSFFSSTSSGYPVCTSFSYFYSIFYIFFRIYSTSYSAFDSVFRSLRSLFSFFYSSSIYIFLSTIIDYSSFFFCKPSRSLIYLSSFLYYSPSIFRYYFIWLYIFS